MQVTRKRFLQAAVSAVGASALGVAACGDDSGSGGSGGSTTTTGSTTTGGSPTTTTGGTTTSGTTTGTTTGSTTSSTTGSTTTGGNLTCGAEIATNHPMAHEMTVSAADVQAGVDKTYNIQGASMHPHTVTLTAADFTTLAGGGTVTKTSSSDAMHTHEVTVTCMA